MPTVVEASVPVPPYQEGETPTDILKPDGKSVGEQGENAGIRALPGGEGEARELLDRLARGGKDITPPSYLGKLVQMPDGSVMGYHSKPKSGPPTIDLNIPGLNIRKIKFPRGA